MDSVYPVYLDYAATTPVDPEVISAMHTMLGPQSHFGNPSSFFHVYGARAREYVEQARSQVAELIGATAQEIIWTSGATEANNLALIGTAQAYRSQGRHIVTLKTEHASVLETCRYLETQGFKVSYLSPEPNGLLDLDRLKRVLHSETILVSVMHGNNETGVLQDIQAIGELAHLVGAKMHVDASQTVGKIPLNLKSWPVDLLSLSGHKMYGPKGIGALFVRQKPRARLMPQMHGGGQERELRSGTLPTHQIVGLGQAAWLCHQQLPSENPRLRTLKEAFLKKLFKQIPGVRTNGTPDEAHSVPHIVNLCFEGVSAAALKNELTSIAISGGSACHSQAVMPSHVLTAMGIPHEEALGAVRLSWGRWTEKNDLEQAIGALKQAVKKIQGGEASLPSRQDQVFLKESI